MKDEILRLRKEGKTYNEIQSILNCSKSTISYYCNDEQKEKTRNRTKKLREKNKLLQKTDNFKSKNNNSKTLNTIKNTDKNINEKIRRFNKIEKNKKVNKNNIQTFTWKDVIEKFGENTFCYLSGIEINLYKDEYHLDHIIPRSKGGNNSLDNLGILYKDVNIMKSDLTIDELLDWCKKILEFNGFIITKK